MIIFTLYFRCGTRTGLGSCVHNRHREAGMEGVAFFIGLVVVLLAGERLIARWP